jgi:hypothetical protein
MLTGAFNRMRKDTDVWQNVKPVRTGVECALRSSENRVKTFDRD